MLFVAGVHAVGKTFVLKPVCESLGMRHATASQLIQEQRGTASWTISRQVDDVDENQRMLLEAVRRSERIGETLVLDGHFVLRRGVNVHEKISVDIFSQLRIKGVILLEAPSAIILERLQRRGDETWGMDEIENFSRCELDHAETVCRELMLPLVRLNLPVESDVRNAIKKLVG